MHLIACYWFLYNWINLERRHPDSLRQHTILALYYVPSISQVSQAGWSLLEPRPVTAEAGPRKTIVFRQT